MLTVSLVLAAWLQAGAPAVPHRLVVPGPNTWIAFAADVRITSQDRPEQWGRYAQDEHGCVRQDMVHPDGSALVSITNYQTERFYRLFHGVWTVQPMKMGPVPHRPIQRMLDAKAPSIEGFDAYSVDSLVRSPRGDYRRQAIVIPALNFYEAVSTMPTGERRTAVNIRVGPQPQDLFLPPEGATLTEVPGFGGFMSFSGIGLRIQFSNDPPREIATIEEHAFPVKTPGGMELTLVTSVVDPKTNTVRIRLLAHAKPVVGNVTGDLIDEVTIPFGASAQTTKTGETLRITVMRVGTAQVPRR